MRAAAKMRTQNGVADKSQSLPFVTDPLLSHKRSLNYLQAYE
jgi:hypothetical protein